jgi:hypothetical protein
MCKSILLKKKRLFATVDSATTSSASSLLAKSLGFSTPPSQDANTSSSSCTVSTVEPKRVQFVEATSIAPAVASSVVDESCWWQDSEKEESRAAASHEAAVCRAEDQMLAQQGQGHFAFSETYTNLYHCCHVTSNDGAKADDFALEEAVSPEVISLLALTSPTARGLEDRVVPRIAIQRRLVRQHIIRTVCQISKKVQTHTGSAAAVSQVCQNLTLPARKFAHILALADVSAAVQEYTATTQEADQQCLKSKRCASECSDSPPPSSSSSKRIKLESKQKSISQLNKLVAAAAE